MKSITAIFLLLLMLPGGMPIASGMSRFDEASSGENRLEKLGSADGNQSEDPPARVKRFSTPPFQGPLLINLPTTRLLPARSILFRITHHFYHSVKSGYPDFYGFDGPAAVFFSFGYGISDSLSLTLGRSNLFQEFEFSLKWRLLEPGSGAKVPIGAALTLGSDLATQSRPGIKVLDKDNLKLNMQLSLSWQLNDRFTMLLVPAYSTNTDHLSSSTQGTFALGCGLRLRVSEDISLLGEWLPVLSGYKTQYNGWSFGIEKKIGWHVFQLYALNSLGITSDQYLSGGDLRLGAGDWRFGFSIFRQF